MSNPHKETKHHEPCSVNPQHINVRNPVTSETIRSHQEEHQHDYFTYRIVRQYLVSKMQNKEDISSYIHRKVWLNCLDKLTKKTTDNTKIVSSCEVSTWF